MGETWPVQVNEVFANRLRELRQRRGLSQAQLASALVKYDVVLDGSSITRIEAHGQPGRSTRSIRLHEAVAIADVLRVSLEDMLGVTRSVPEQLDDAREALDAAVSKALALKKALDERAGGAS